MTDWVKGSDPSWWPRVLTVLQRDHPQVADIVWSTAISENAAEIGRKRGMEATEGAAS
jgi:hypothetical protein